MLQPKDVDYVIYHKNCPDGLGASLAAWVFSKCVGITYHAAAIGTPPPEGIDGKNVLICDFCYPIAVLRDMQKRVKNLLVIDHHKTSMEDLRDFPDTHKIFNMERSGAMLTWIYFFSSTLQADADGKSVPSMAAHPFGEDMYKDGLMVKAKVPLLICYIEDNDLWRKKMPETEIFYSWIQLIPKTHEEYAKYLNSELLLTTFRETGAIVKSVNDFYIEQSLDYVNIDLCEINRRYYFMAETNLPILQSPLGNRMMTRFPNIDFSVVYTVTSSGTSFSLRSTDEHADVSQIAKFYGGGGGHAPASGVKMAVPLAGLPCQRFNVPYDTLSRVKRTIVFSFPAVIVCSTHDKAVLAKYLMQKRWVPDPKVDDPKAKRNQNAAFLTKGAPVDLAVVWNYNAEFKKTVFQVAFAETATPELIAEIKGLMSLDKDNRLVTDSDLNYMVEAWMKP